MATARLGDPARGPLLAGFDAGQLAVIAEFLDRATAYAYDRVATLRRGVLDGTAAGTPVRNATTNAIPNAAGSTAGGNERSTR